MTYLYNITHADTCELAHQLTLKELKEKGKAHEIDIQPEDGDGSYIPYVQNIFNQYINMIEHHMLYDNIEKDTINIDISENDAQDIINGESFMVFVFL